MSPAKGRPAPAIDRPPMPEPTRATRRLTVDLPVDQHRALKVLAAELGLDASTIVRALIDQRLIEAGR